MAVGTVAMADKDTSFFFRSQCVCPILVVIEILGTMMHKLNKTTNSEAPFSKCKKVKKKMVKLWPETSAVSVFRF